MILVGTLGGCTQMPDQVVVPARFRAEVKQAGKECTGIPAQVIAAQLEQESGWDPDAVSPSGARGIAQFMPDTWEYWGRDLNGDGRADPHHAGEAIDAQGRLMCFLHGEATRSGIRKDPVVLALAAYNAGWGPVEENGGVPPFPETRDYVDRIMTMQRNVRFEH